MKTVAVHVAACALIWSTLCAPVGASPPVPGDAAQACESSVIDDLQELRGKDAQQIEFVGAQRSITPAQGAAETSVKGAGRYAGGTPFTYSCTYNSQTRKTSGVVIRDKGGSARPARPEAVWQPDLTRLSPEACETAVAAVLKVQHPRVGHIAFGSDSRQLKPAANGERTSLEGQGGVERAPGMSKVPFGYRCEFDHRSGQLISATATASE